MISRSTALEYAGRLAEWGLVSATCAAGAALLACYALRPASLRREVERVHDRAEANAGARREAGLCPEPACVRSLDHEPPHRSRRVHEPPHRSRVHEWTV